MFFKIYCRWSCDVLITIVFAWKKMQSVLYRVSFRFALLDTTLISNYMHSVPCVYRWEKSRPKANGKLLSLACHLSLDYQKPSPDEKKKKRYLCYTEPSNRNARRIQYRIIKTHIHKRGDAVCSRRVATFSKQRLFVQGNTQAPRLPSFGPAIDAPGHDDGRARRSKSVRLPFFFFFFSAASRHFSVSVINDFKFVCFFLFSLREEKTFIPTKELKKKKRIFFISPPPQILHRDYLFATWIWL